MPKQWHRRLRKRDLAAGSSSGWLFSSRRIYEMGAHRRWPKLPDIRSLPGVELFSSSFASPVTVKQGESAMLPSCNKDRSPQATRLLCKLRPRNLGDKRVELMPNNTACATF